MTKRQSVEALNNSLHDILDQPELPFGGKTMVFSGDFRQVLPVVQRGSKAQVVGASLIYAQQFHADDVVAIAGLTKFMRTFGLLLLVPMTAMWMSRSESAEDKARPKGLRRSALPWFVIAFILLVGVRTMGDAWMDGPAWRSSLAFAWQASEMLLLCGMAAVGLGITLTHLREAGWRPLAVAFLATSATGATALALLHV